MTAKRAFFGMIVVLALLGGLGLAALIIGNSVLNSKAHDLVNLKLKDVVLNNQETALEQAQAEVKQYTPLNVLAETIVPQDKDQAQTVREIVAFANQAGIKVGSITFPESTLGDKSNTGISQVTPVKGIAGVDQMPITVQSDTTQPNTFEQLISFLKNLENDRHTAQVSQLTITPAANGGNALSFSIVLTIYIKP